ncbi:uroporphyrinogen III synthase [Longibacter salinarum]|uniref:Uroporphyrinogen III synthase n=1 Tax=Longibacter salinarum TaxID=1850348 RepID=A0A2A8D2P3_9BACT|nr:uroporphyrinogen-III synthase [Longibacter salinarum]PEN15206.1 uroporphyrinogen III synthase [Longibacter salinarum]
MDVVLLRSCDSPDPYVHAFEELGLTASCCPVLQFDFPNPEQLEQQLNADGKYSGLILTSPRAAHALNRSFDTHPDMRDNWTDRPVFVVGPKTAAAVESAGLTPLGQDAGNAASLVDRIADVWVEKRLRRPLLFLSGNRRRDTIPTGLAAAGIPLAEQEVYQTSTRRDIELPDGVRWLSFFSPSGLEALEASRVMLHNYRLAAIGPTTAQKIRDVGLEPAAVADAPTPDDLARAIVHADETSEA